MKDGSSVFIHRGLCGVPLAKQCIFIGVGYMILSVTCVVLSSMMLHNPLKYVALNQISVDSTKFNLSEAGDTKKQSAMDEIDRLTTAALHSVGVDAIELLVESIATLLVSASLIHGVRQEKAAFVFPWVIIETLVTVTNLLCFLLKTTSTSFFSASQIVVGLLHFAWTIYCVLSVYSYYQILKIKKRKVITFLDHEFQGGVGSWYHTLDNQGGDDIVPTHAGPAPPYSDVAEKRTEVQSNSNPFRRPPYTEKAVPMTEEEDLGKENVLFAKV